MAYFRVLFLACYRRRRGDPNAIDVELIKNHRFSVCFFYFAKLFSWPYIRFWAFLLLPVGTANCSRIIKRVSFNLPQLIVAFSQYLKLAKYITTCRFIINPLRRKMQITHYFTNMYGYTDNKWNQTTHYWGSRVGQKKINHNLHVWSLTGEYKRRQSFRQTYKLNLIIYLI